MTRFDRARKDQPLRISAEAHNAWCDAAEAISQHRPGTPPPAPDTHNPQTVAYIVNTTSTDIDRGEVVSLDSLAITRDDNEREFHRVLVFNHVAITADHRGKFGVAIEPIAAGRVGRCVIAGVVQAKLSVGDADHTHADVEAESATLKSASSGGAEILWKASGTGSLWAVVRISTEAAGVRRFELKTALTPSADSTTSNATAYLVEWDSDTSAYVADTDTEFEVYDFAKKFRGRGKDAFPAPHDQGSRGLALAVKGKWEIINMQSAACRVWGRLKNDLAAAAPKAEILLVSPLFPAGAIVVDQSPNGNAAVAFEVSNSRGFVAPANAAIEAVWCEEAERWEIVLVSANSPSLRFELKDNLTPGGTAVAHPLEWNGVVADYVANAAVNYTVVDMEEKLRGRGIGKFPAPNNVGSRGYARYIRDRNAWEITDMTPHALRIRGELTADLEGTSGTIQSVKVMQPTGGFIVPDQLAAGETPSGNITVYNSRGHEADAGDTIEAVWDEDSDKWEVVPCGTESAPETPTAMLLKALVDMPSGLKASDENITVNNVQVIAPAGAAVPVVTSIPNVFGWTADSGAMVVFAPDSAGTWMPLEIERKVPITPTTDAGTIHSVVPSSVSLYRTGTDLYVKFQTQEKTLKQNADGIIVSMTDGAVTDRSASLALSTQAVPEDMRVDGTNIDLLLRNVYVIGRDGDASRTWNTWDTGTNCS